MNWFKKQDKPNYDFSRGELKILWAVWLKNTPMSYEEILGACESACWKRENAEGWLNSLIEKGALFRREDGRYDAGLSSSQYQAFLRKRGQTAKLYIPVDRQRLSEYDIRELEKLLEQRMAELDAEERED